MIAGRRNIRPMLVSVVKMTPQVVRLGGELSGGRGLFVDIMPAGRTLLVQVYTRRAGELLHAWPGDCDRDFFDHREEILLVGGLSEVQDGCKGKRLDVEFVAVVMDAIETVMHGVAGDPIDDEADVAA